MNLGALQPTVFRMLVGRGSLRYAAQTPKRLLAREAAAWQGEKKSCEPITQLATGLLGTEG